jgi:Icc-related predicted phosphoesterase
MQILAVGDIHGRVFHLMVVLQSLRTREGICPDMIVQIGDLGAFPDPAGSGLLENKFVKADPTELDFSRFLTSDGELAEALKRFRAELGCPIYFIRGNHEDHAWLESKAAGSEGKPAPIDPYGIFVFIPDGTVMRQSGKRMAFLGGNKGEPSKSGSIDQQAYEQVLSGEGGKIDILLTHDAPYGIDTSYRGKTQGSEQITRLVEELCPKYLISGHYHHMMGPRKFGETTYLGLAILVPPVRKDPDQQFLPGSIAILDLEEGTLEPLQYEWLTEFDNHIDYIDAFVDQTS